MTKMIVGAFVGAILLFFWQFASWTFMPVHKAEFKYTETETEILAALDGLEHGSYMVPGTPPGTSMDDEQALLEESVGKPWAYIHYRPEAKMTMGMNMFRGFAANFVAVLLLCWVLVKIGENSFFTTLKACLAIGILSYCTTSYSESIWFETNSLGNLTDALVGWGLCGAWLGWWLNR